MRKPSLAVGLVVLLGIFFTTPIPSYATCGESLAKVKVWSQKMLPGFSQRLNGLSVVDSLETLFQVFGELKQEQLKYLDSYLNRSLAKQKMTPEEVGFLKVSYHIENLEPEDVQLYYANEIRRLLIFVENLIIEKRIFSQQVEVDKKELKFLARTYKGLVNKSDAVDRLVGELDLAKIYPPWEAQGFLDLLKIFRVHLSHPEKAKQILRESQFSGNQFAIEQALIGGENPSRCCKSFSGCTFCPLNRGLRAKSKELKN